MPHSRMANWDSYRSQWDRSLLNMFCAVHEKLKARLHYASAFAYFDLSRQNPPTPLTTMLKISRKRKRKRIM